MKIITNLLKNAHDEWLLNTTVSLNDVNPIVDRIMEDNSIEGVIMTNKEGAPILTNINIMRATNYGAAMQHLGQIAQICVKEIVDNELATVQMLRVSISNEITFHQDLFDELLVLRLNTNKREMMAAHHSEFNIIVLQQPGMQK